MGIRKSLCICGRPPKLPGDLGCLEKGKKKKQQLIFMTILFPFNLLH